MHLLNPNVYILQGTFPKEYELAAYLDSVRIEARMEDWETTSALERFKEWELLKWQEGDGICRFASESERVQKG